jgi:hypothetical protein
MPWRTTPPKQMTISTSTRGASKKGNIVVKTWKKKHYLEHYFNCSNPPDLAPIKNCWRPPKQFMARFPHWDEFETRELALEGWQKVSIQFNPLHQQTSR